MGTHNNSLNSIDCIFKCIKLFISNIISLQGTKNYTVVNLFLKNWQERLRLEMTMQSRLMAHFIFWGLEGISMTSPYTF